MSTSRAQHDVVVVGAGHNSLIAAAYLARCGLSVLVLEKHSYAGGGAVTKGLTLPGFLHDTHATAAVLLQTSPVLTHDELGLLSKFDLRFVSPPNNEMTVFSDGDSLVWYRDLERTCQEIAKFSEQDADVYRQTVKFVQGVLPLMGMSMARPPVSFGNFLSLVEKAPFGNELIVAMMQSSYEVIIQRFQHPKVQMALLRRSLTSACGPEERGTGLNILMMMAAIHSLPLAIIVGGTQQLTQSTVRSIEAYGGSIRLNAPVKRIINSNGDARSVELLDGELIHARRAVLASIHPHDLGEMVNGLDIGLVTRARRTTPSYFGTLMVHAALKEKVQWKVGDIAHQCTIVDLVDSASVDDFRSMCDAPRWGAVSKQFTTGVVVNTNYDSSRAPPGQHVMSSFNFVPYNLKDGGPERWDEIKEEYAEWVLNKITAYAPNISVDSVLAHAVESPLDLARYSPSFVAGDVMGLGSYLHQTMGMRPTPELSQYRVPGAGGLYLTGPFMHPGGGLTGGGRAVAIRVMEDLKVDYSKVIRV